MVGYRFRLFLTTLLIWTAHVKAASNSVGFRTLHQNDAPIMEDGINIMSSPRLNLHDRFQFQSSHSLSMLRSLSRACLYNSDEHNRTNKMDLRINSSTAFVFPPSILLPWWRKKKASSCSLSTSNTHHTHEYKATAIRKKKYLSIFALQSMSSKNAAGTEPIAENSNPTETTTTYTTAYVPTVSVAINTQSDGRQTLLDTEGEDEQEEQPIEKNPQTNGENSRGESVHLKLYSLTKNSATDATEQNTTTTNDQVSISNQTSEPDATSDDKNITFATLHTYYHPQTNTTLYGLGISLPKFKLWIQYTLHHQFQHSQHDSNSLHANETSSPPLSAELNDHHKSSVEVITAEDEDLKKYISSSKINTHDEEMRIQLRQLWFARHLICDKTEVLASYGNDADNEESNDTHHAQDIDREQSSSDGNNKKKRGGFDDLLKGYADRLVDILEDEAVDHDDDFPSSSTASLFSSQVSSSFHIQTWLQHQYGENETMHLSHPNFSQLAEGEQLKTMKHFLEWFREQFPYFYDGCDSCGASYRSDSSEAQMKEEESDLSMTVSNVGVIDDITVVADADSDANFGSQGRGSDRLKIDGSDACNTNDSSADDHTHNNEDDNEDTEGTFLGYVHPTPHEIFGRSSRTELYHCHRCQHYTRFPRYNAVSSIVRHRRGRCGEYSILLYRILRDLGHNTRWVVDWADHVWAECWVGNDGATGENLPNYIENLSPTPPHLVTSDAKERMQLQQANATCGRWIHLDPCEAAVDEPLLYQDWGKKQTFIMAFWAPIRSFKPIGEYDLKNVSYMRDQQNGEFGVLEGNFSFATTRFPFVEDVTQKYTTDSMDNIQHRREVSDAAVKSSIDLVEGKLRKTLVNFFQNRSPK